MKFRDEDIHAMVGIGAVVGVPFLVLYHFAWTRLTADVAAVALIAFMVWRFFKIRPWEWREPGWVDPEKERYRKLAAAYMIWEQMEAAGEIPAG